MFKSTVSIGLVFITLCPHMGLFVTSSFDNSTTEQIVNNFTIKLNAQHISESFALEEDQLLLPSQPLEVPLVNNTLDKPDGRESNFKPFDYHQDNANETMNDDGYNINFEEKAREDSFTVTKASEHPYVVLVMAKAGTVVMGICTGSLVTLEWVLTAGHCLTSDTLKITSILIYAGGNSLQEIVEHRPVEGSQIRNSSEFFTYPGFYLTKTNSDIGLIKVDPKFVVNNTVKTINISTQPWNYHSYYNCTFTGFGRVQLDETSDYDKTRKTSLLLLKKPCLCTFMLRVLFGEKDVSQYICTKPLEDYGVCPGDSGGGLVCDGEIRGVAMQLMMIHDMNICLLSEFSITKTMCGTRNTLSMFQDTCPYLRWINQHIQMFNDSQISPKCVNTSCQQLFSYHCKLLILSVFIIHLCISQTSII